jgi:L-ascorbate metabolism protein UlaG (beta-lactamase superfamily)
MKVKWFGHAAFLITAEKGGRIITDPYEPGGYGGAVGYGPIPDQADIVLVSHDHADHNFVQGVPGKPQVIKGPGSHHAGSLEIKGMASFHDGRKGAERGANTIFCFVVDGLRVCHLGDLGYVPAAAEVKQIGAVDLLLIPVGGVYTLDPAQATATLQKLNPRIAIPMHYKTPRCGFPLARVEEFTKGKPRVRSLPGSELELHEGSLPASPEIVVLTPAL